MTFVVENVMLKKELYSKKRCIWRFLTYISESKQQEYSRHWNYMLHMHNFIYFYASLDLMFTRYKWESPASRLMQTQKLFYVVLLRMYRKRSCRY
jgi:hypothetical protein